MRGRQRAIVTLLLTVSAASTGGLVGFAAGVLWLALRLPAATPVLFTALVVAAVGADLLHRRPLSVGRQVPVEWSQLFPPELVAVLYGARLGVGPLTVLSSWLWWAALVAGAASGPLASTLTGITFAVIRSLTMFGVAEYARRSMATRMAQIRAGEPAVGAVSACLALAATALAWR